MSDSSNDLVGEQIGNYRLLRLLGKGGYANVYLGEHIYHKTRVAIKLFHRNVSDADLEEILTEARTIARLEHPRIIRIFECNVENEYPYLVMGYAPQGSLRQRHPRGTRLPCSLVVSYVEQIATALQYAHEHKLVHRDVKPENMLVGEDGQLLLSDFGLVTFARTTGNQTTGDMRGTVAYMAPEQLHGKPRTKSDQYSLAIVAYEWLCGQRPFSGSFAEIASQHILAAPPSLKEQVSDLPLAVEQVIFKALAKHPANRFENITLFAQALQQASLSPVSTVSSSAPIQRVASPQTLTPPPDSSRIPSDLLPSIPPSRLVEELSTQIDAQQLWSYDSPSLLPVQPANAATTVPMQPAQTGEEAPSSKRLRKRTLRTLVILAGLFLLIGGSFILGSGILAPSQPTPKPPKVSDGMSTTIVSTTTVPATKSVTVVSQPPTARPTQQPTQPAKPAASPTQRTTPTPTATTQPTPTATATATATPTPSVPTLPTVIKGLFP
jgi:serine/threonine protein kinase